MKTILYQPLFINPQAYFVFPQLYHIEKGDSYIEPANITGQLIINNLSEGLTLTPTVNVIQDSNQVDFSLFKGKHIRISQYTNIGAVVLGEWYIPGTPEPEQPDWFKESIVAWYSPYCKQGLTNYDVIEAYTEDFTTWVYNQNAGVANITSNTITISESFTSQNIVEDTNSPYSDLSIYVTGITEDVYLFVKDMSGRVEEIRKNGLHTFKNNSRFFGFSVNKPAACNIVIKQLPTSILKDFSGNKHDAYLYGFKGKLNSGVGIYAQDFKNWSYGSTINTDISTKSYNKFHIVKKKADNWFGFTIGIPKNNYYNQSYKLKFNINKKIDDIKFAVVSTDGNLQSTQAYSIYINDGSIIDIPIISEEIFNNKEETNIYYDFGTNKDIEIDVELMANYPNQLCYDGKSYAVAYGLPILTDYTVIANRTWFKDKVKTWSYFIDKSKAFVFERTSNGNNFSAKSFAAETSIKLEETNVSYQTKTSYNGNVINYHSDQYDNDDRLVIGTTKDVLGNQCFIGCHGDIFLFNRTLTEYLLCGENIPIAKRVLNIDITDSDKEKTPYFYINPGKNYGFEIYRESPNGKKEVVVGFSSVNDVETLSFQDFSDCALIGEHDSTWSSMKTSVLLWKPVKDDIPDKTLYPHFFYNQGVLMSTNGNLKSPFFDFFAIPCLNVGVTSQRPGNADNGFQFFDVTLHKPVWWNGSSWVDANGATV